MPSFVVLSHDGYLEYRADEKTVFVRDHFSVWALVAPLIWLIWHRLWFHAGMIFLATIMLMLLVQIPSLAAAALPINLLLGVLVALEGPNWRINAFRNRGYFDQGIVQAENLDDAQIIWALEQSANTRQIKAHKQQYDSDRLSQDLLFGGTD